MKTEKCRDCSAPVTCSKPCDYKGHSHWGIHAATVRCMPCGAAFTIKVRESRNAQEKARIAEMVAHQEARDKNEGTCPDDGVLCTECCPHQDTDHGYCNECEADLNDSIASDAYDRAKDARYG